MNVQGITDKGAVREINQDAYCFSVEEERDHAVVVLCDGMGGERAGEIASDLASRSFLEYALKSLDLPEPMLAVDAAREATAWANLHVYDRANRDDSCSGMGTTLVAAVINGSDAAVVNVGDSRCYWLAEGQLQQVTRDHSWVQDMVDRGVISSGEARSHPRKNLITRSIGHQRRIRSDIFRIDLRPGDMLLLCSDGLSNLVTESELTAVLAADSDLKGKCGALLNMALERGAPDNVTAVILRR